MTNHVYMRCPSCGYEWHGASIVEGAWWAEGLTPEKSCARPRCPSCECRPPMLVARVETEGEKVQAVA